MSLPAPNLDDRRFQDLVDDAKRLVQQRCPEWTDHNVSDPGVTLIEAFAWMTDQLLYRLNRVPGPQLRQVPRADRRASLPAHRRAHADVTFWLSAPQPETVTIPAGTQVATVRTGSRPAIVFSTTEDCPIIACQPAARRVDASAERGHATTPTRWPSGSGFFCFDARPSRATCCSSA